MPYKSLNRVYKKKKPPMKKFVAKVKKFMAVNKAERKYYSIIADAGGNIQVGPDGTTLRLTQMTSAVAGTAVGKIGNEVLVTGLRAKIHMWMTSTTLPFNRARIVLVYDREYHGTVLLNTELFLNSNDTTLAYNNFVCPFNPAFVNDPKNGITGKRMDILADKTYMFGSQANVGTLGAIPPLSHIFSYNKTFKVPKKITFDSVTGDATSSSHQLYAYMFIGNSGTDTQNPTYTYSFRVHYTDA